MDPVSNGLFPPLFPLRSVGWTTGRHPEITSRLADEFESLFVPVSPADLDRRAKRIKLTAVKAVVFVVDESAAATAFDRQGTK
jgi:hypothetical protein